MRFSNCIGLFSLLIAINSVAFEIAPTMGLEDEGDLIRVFEELQSKEFKTYDALMEKLEKSSSREARKVASAARHWLHVVRIDSVKNKNANFILENNLHSSSMQTLAYLSQRVVDFEANKNERKRLNLLKDFKKHIIDERRIDNLLAFMCSYMEKKYLHDSNLILVDDFMQNKTIFDGDKDVQSLCILSNELYKIFNLIIEHKLFNPIFQDGSLLVFGTHEVGLLGFLRFDEIVNGIQKVLPVVISPGLAISYMTPSFNQIRIFNRGTEILTSPSIIIAPINNEGLYYLSIYAGGTTYAPYTVSAFKYALSESGAQEIAQTYGFEKWSDKVSYLPFAQNDFEALGFKAELKQHKQLYSLLENGADEVKLGLLGYSKLLTSAGSSVELESIVVEEINDAHTDLLSNIGEEAIDEVQAALEREWELRREEVIRQSELQKNNNHNAGKGRKKRDRGYQNSNAQKKRQQQEERAAKQRFMKEFKREAIEKVGQGRYNFRKIAKLINEVMKGAPDREVTSRQEGTSHLILTAEGKSPVTLVKLHNGRTLATKQTIEIIERVFNLVH